MMTLKIDIPDGALKKVEVPEAVRRRSSALSLELYEIRDYGDWLWFDRGAITHLLMGEHAYDGTALRSLGRVMDGDFVGVISWTEEVTV